MEAKIEVTTYEQARLNYFTVLMEKANNKFNRLFKKYKDAPYLSEEFQRLIDAGHGAEFCKDVVKMLEKGYRKQEWISVEDRLPDTDEVLVYYRKGVGHAAPKKQGLDKMDWDVFFNITGTTHWMPLPQPPKENKND